MSESLRELQRLSELVINKSLDLGADQAEASLGIDSGLSVTVRLGDVETLEFNRDKGMGITVYKNHSRGSASTSDLTETALLKAVEAAYSIASHTAADEYSGLADKELMATDYPFLDLHHPWDLSSEHAIDLANSSEKAALELDKRITNSEGASVSSHSGLHLYANTHGFSGHYQTSRHSLSCCVIGQDGGLMQRDYWYSMSRNANELADPASIGTIAAQRVLDRLNARKVATGSFPVIFSPDVSSGLIGHFFRAIRGGSLYRKTSFLLDSLGQQVFPDWINITEDPHINGALGSAPFDSEGVRTAKQDLVSDGKVARYILDSYSARRLGMQTTGNAGGVHNVSVNNNGFTADSILKEMGSGLLVTELMGQGVNGVTGDYSRGAAGFWVENGEIAYPVEEITIAGNLRDMFSGIAAIADDVDYRKNIQVGSILLSNMTIAGS